MNESQRKSQETRQRNLEAKIALYEEQTAAIRSARLAIQRVFDSEKSTSEQILRAAQFLAEIAVPRHY